MTVRPHQYPPSGSTPHESRSRPCQPEVSSIAAAGPRPATAALGQELHARLNSLTRAHCSVFRWRRRTDHSCASTFAINEHHPSSPSQHNIRRAKIPIAARPRTNRTRSPAAPPPLTSRGFLPWRFSYAGPRCKWRHRHGAGIRKPSHNRTHAVQQIAPSIRSPRRRARAASAALRGRAPWRS